MFFNRLLLCSFALWISFSTLSAQAPDTHWCGTKGVSPWLKEYRARFGQFPRKSNDTVWLYVPCTFHITGTDSGNGYFELASAFRALCEMNKQFVPARIRYYLVPGDMVRYHNNSRWHNHDWDGGEEMINENLIPDRFNIFIVQNPAGACGYAWYDAVVMGKGCSGPGNGTWAHEAGHHFSLPHTFYGWENSQTNFAESAPAMINGFEVEKMDGSNCLTSGDFFCDTKPDYLSFRWACNNEIKSPQLQRDPNGISFQSDGTQFMSYALDDCMSRFMPDQIAAMRENLRTEHASYLQINEPILQIPDEERVRLIGPIDSQIVHNNGFDLRWHKVTNASFYQVEVFLYSTLNTPVFRRMMVKDTSVKFDRTINNRTLYWRVRAYSEGDVCQPFNGEQIGIFQTRNLVATNELERGLTAEIMPNPVSDIAQLFVECEENMDVRLRLSNAAGQILSDRPARLFAGENTLPISVAEYPEGVYFVTLYNEKGSLIRRVVVQ